MRHAHFILSLDCEFLWGSYSNGGCERYPYLRSGFQKYFDQLLSLFEQYDIKATFAFVASICLDADEFRRMATKISGLDSQGHLDTVSKLSEETPLHWYDKSLVVKIVSSKQHHEIGSHSLTHLPFNRIAEQRTAQSEFELSHSILSKCAGRSVTTFIFPENQIQHLDCFRKSPYTMYRGNDLSWHRSLPCRRFFHFLDQLLPISPRPVQVQVDQYGNSYLPGSLMFFPYDGLRSLVPDRLRFLKMKRGIDRAIREGKIFHLWFHPWNLGSSERMAKVLEKVLSYVGKKRDEGVLSISTLGEVLPSP